MDTYINRTRIATIYSIPNCEFCEKAKNLLHSKQNYVIYEINLEKEPDLRKTVKDTLGTTVPQVVIDGTYIGGYRELQEYISKWH